MLRRKKSIYGKRKTKKPVKIVEKIYPEFITEFKKEVESKTKFKVIADQYAENGSYNVGVLKKVQDDRHHCIWMDAKANLKEDLDKFWNIKFE